MDIEGGIRPEYNQGQIIPRDDSTKNHNRISMNLVKHFDTYLPETFRTYSTTLKLEVEPRQKYVYPDIVCTCNPKDLNDDLEDQITFPYLVTEVISKVSFARDGFDKKTDYLKMPSLQYYVLVDQYKCYVQTYERYEDCWAFRFYDTMNQVVCLPLVNLQIPVSEIYRWIKFE